MLGLDLVNQSNYANTVFAENAAFYLQPVIKQSQQSSLSGHAGELNLKMPSLHFGMFNICSTRTTSVNNPCLSKKKKEKDTIQATAFLNNQPVSCETEVIACFQDNSSAFL